MAGGLAVSAAAHETSAPVASSCVQVADTPVHGGPFVFVGGVRATAGGPCVYTSDAVGGYRAAGADWRVVVHKADGRTRAFSSANRSAPCWENVIAPGDVVEASATGYVVAGPGIDC